VRATDGSDVRHAACIRNLRASHRPPLSQALCVMTDRDPKRDKERSLAKDRRTIAWFSDKGLRKTWPRKKQLANSGFRRRYRQALATSLDETDKRLNSITPKTVGSKGNVSLRKYLQETKRRRFKRVGRRAHRNYDT